MNPLKGATDLNTGQPPLDAQLPAVCSRSCGVMADLAFGDGSHGYATDRDV